MAKKGGGGGENSKKAQGQARKADAAANKKAAEESKKAAIEDSEWAKGSKKANAKKRRVTYQPHLRARSAHPPTPHPNSQLGDHEDGTSQQPNPVTPTPPSRRMVSDVAVRIADCARPFFGVVIREDEAAKKAEAARKKAERDALLAEEEQNTPGRSAPKNAKSAQKKTRGGLDLDQLDLGDDRGDDRKLATLNASGMENALEALEITNSDRQAKIDRHPERRVKAVFTVWKEARMKKLTDEGYFKIKGHSRFKTESKLWDEFQTSPENPMNQVHASYDATQEEIAEIRAQEKAKIEQRLAEN